MTTVTMIEREQCECAKPFIALGFKVLDLHKLVVRMSQALETCKTECANQQPLHGLEANQPEEVFKATVFHHTRRLLALCMRHEQLGFKPPKMCIKVDHHRHRCAVVAEGRCSHHDIQCRPERPLGSCCRFTCGPFHDTSNCLISICL